ncbi:MAG TPA: nuclear transport factor 2 family protein [Blastocatellia bacterium]|nr:nuclear transport factor 2 family protein [Blastocatellia bacterium]
MKSLTSAQRKLGAFIVAGAVAFSLLAGGLPPTAKADNVSVLLGWAAAWNSNDPDQVASIFTDDAVYIDKPSTTDTPPGGVYVGRDEIRAYAAGFLSCVHILKLAAESISIRGERGWVEWTLTAGDVCLAGTGNTFTLHGVALFEVHGAKISKVTEYYDRVKLLRQLNLLP